MDKNQVPSGPISQQLVKMQTNRNQILSNGRQLSTYQRQKKSCFAWTGFFDKTLWDWFQLLGVLAVPIVVAVATSIITNQQAASTDAFNRTQIAIEMKNSKDTLNYNELQGYISDISNEIDFENLKISSFGSAVRIEAREKTLLAVRQLDGLHNEYLLQFLRDEGLISPGANIIDLEGSDLHGVDLSGDDLSLVDLAYVDLSGANLSKTNLERANLKSTILIGANLDGALLYDVQDFTQQQLDQVSSCVKAFFPPGLVCYSKNE